MPITIEQYIEKYDLYPEFIEWARSTGCTTIQQLFVHPDISRSYAITIADSMLSDRDLRIFACWCVRKTWSLLCDSSREAVEAAERYAIGQATDEQLSAAADAAYLHAQSASAVAYDDAAAARASDGPNDTAIDSHMHACAAAAAAAAAADHATATRTAYAATYVITATQAINVRAAAIAAADVCQLKQLQTYELTEEMR